MTDIAPPFNPANQPQPTRKVSFLLGLGIFLFPLIFAWFTLRQGYSTLAKAISFIWLVLSLFIVLAPAANKGSPTSTPEIQSAAAIQNEQPASTENQATEPTPAPEPTAIEISAGELFANYEANEVAADRNFKGQALKVTGTVQSIDSGLGDGATVNLSTGDEYGFNNVMADGDDGFDDQAAQLSKGQKITLNCVGGGEIIGSPVLRECIIS